MTDGIELHPLANALLNLTSAVLLLSGWRAIKGGDRAAHKRFMVGTIVVSGLFLASYVVRFALTGTHRFPVEGAVKIAYLAILMSHMVLAMAVPVGVVVAVRRALRDDLPGHRRVVRWLFPAWVYVSVTGVLVYVLLYHVGPALAAASV